MFSWLTGPSKREAELSRQLSEANAALESLKGVREGNLLNSPDSGGMFPSPSANSLAKASDQLSHFRGWTFACVHALASRIAGQAVRAGVRKVGRSLPKAGKGWQPPGVEAVEQHEVLSLLADPNDLQVAWSLWYFTVASLELTGRCLWFLSDEGILPIPTSWIVGFKGTTRFESFQIRPPGQVDEIPIPVEEACYFFYPHPRDPKESAAPLQAAGYPVAIDDQILQSQYSMFARGIHPSHALIIGKKCWTGRLN